jgi:hypothetical protein
VFTARYALSPYIKQIRFVFKGLKSVHTPTYVSTIKSSSSGVIHWCISPVRRPYVKVTLKDKLTGPCKHCTNESLMWLLN